MNRYKFLTKEQVQKMIHDYYREKFKHIVLFPSQVKRFTNILKEIF